MNSSTLRIVSIVQARVDAFLKDIFDICKPPEDSLATDPKTLLRTVTTEIAICDAVEVAIRRRRNGRTLFGHLDTDIVHSIFEIVLDLDQVHDPSLSLPTLNVHRHQLSCLRRVSSKWNSFLLSSPRYWQVIDIKSPPHVITTSIERSGSTPLCAIYCRGRFPPRPGKHLLLEELRACARVRTLRSNDPNAYRLHRWLLQDKMPALRTLELSAKPQPIEDALEPLGDLSSIQHLNAAGWQPPSDATWLAGLRELTLARASALDMELLRVISACANLEQLVIEGRGVVAAGELPRAISPITLHRLKRIRLEFGSHESAAQLIRVLVAPQCLQRTVYVQRALNLGRYVSDYCRFMSLEDGVAPTQYPQSASIFLKDTYLGTCLEYVTESRKVAVIFPSEEEVPAFHDFLQKIQDSLKGPPVTVTITDPAEPTWSFLKSLGDQNIRTIVAHIPSEDPVTGSFLRAIGTGLADLSDGPVTDTATNWPFKSLKSIEIHKTYVNLVDFTGLVEEYLTKSSQPLLEEIVLVKCTLGGMELAQAAERLAGIGITLRGVDVMSTREQLQ